MTARQDVLDRLRGQVAKDREAGRERPLLEYLRAFPDHQSEVARELLDMTDGFAAETHDPAFETSDEDGRYRIIQEIGRGSQGVVWLAEDTRLSRRVALKVITLPPDARTASVRVRENLERVAALEHPSVCRVYDVRREDNRLHVAMAWVDGDTFRSHLNDRADPSLGKETITTLATTVATVAEAVQSAHDADVVHGDLKPANVMITSKGEPVVLDFGFPDVDGAVAGTPAYFSPERTRDPTADRMGDVWALGVLFYEGLFGQRPFQAPTRAGLLQAIRTHEPDIPSSINSPMSRDVTAVIQTALEKNPHRRYPSAGALAEDLRRLVNRRPLTAHRAGPALRMRRWVERNPALALSSLGLGAALVIGLVTTLIALNRTIEARDDKEQALEVIESRRVATGKALGELNLLADLRRIQDLGAWALRLWPPDPALATTGDTGMPAWLASASRLLDRRAHQDAERKRIEASGAAAGGGADRLRILRELGASLATLSDDVRRVRARCAVYADLRATCLERPASAWTVAHSIASDADGPYARTPVDLGRIRWLVPLGPDPESGLLEFADPVTGRPPTRDASGKLVLRDDFGVVFVLLPGGRSRMGARPPTATALADSPHVDPQAHGCEQPVHDVTLAPFLIAKYELTQHQWRVLTGRSPSAGPPSDRHPVERVSWVRAMAVLGRMTWTLPTEAQWEYACRAGTDTPWSTGRTAASLIGSANLRGADPGGPIPVGTLRPNRNGLHDLHGNISEWCRDAWYLYANVAHAPKDGGVTSKDSRRLTRGGCYNLAPFTARSSHRGSTQSTIGLPELGLRPVCPVR
ncbi:MAG: hypothetical protein CMJ83_11520 [Planctomycetes bacterium]|nr:hypothetical protein [Planctomycetota bacterium]